MSRSFSDVVAELVATGLSHVQLTLVLELVGYILSAVPSGQSADNYAERRRAKDRERKRQRRIRMPDSEWMVLSQQIIDRDKATCRYCGSTENIEVDHIVPLSRGGSHAPENLAACCRSCNGRKGGRMLSEWKQSGKQTMSGAVRNVRGMSADIVENRCKSSSLTEVVGKERGNREEEQLPVIVEGQRSQRPKVSRGTRLSADVQISQDDLQFAISAGMTRERALQAWVEFIDYWIGIPGQRGTKLNWSATWRNRVRAIGGSNGYRGPRALQDDRLSVSKAADRLIERAERGEFSFGPRPSLLPESGENAVRLLPKG